MKAMKTNGEVLIANQNKCMPFSTDNRRKDKPKWWLDLVNKKRGIAETNDKNEANNGWTTVAAFFDNANTGDEQSKEQSDMSLNTSVDTATGDLNICERSVQIATNDCLSKVSTAVDCDREVNSVSVVSAGSSECQWIQRRQSDEAESGVELSAASSTSPSLRSGFTNHCEKGVNLRRELSGTGLKNSCVALQRGSRFGAQQKARSDESSKKFAGVVVIANKVNAERKSLADNDHKCDKRIDSKSAINDIDVISSSIDGLVASRRLIFNRQLSDSCEKRANKRCVTTTATMVDDKYKEEIIYENVNGKHYENLVYCFKQRPNSVNSNGIETRTDSSNRVYDDDEDLEYGPGIVDKLRCKFLRYTMQRDAFCDGGCKPIKKCSSLENLLNNNDQCNIYEKSLNHLNGGDQRNGMKCGRIAKLFDSDEGNSVSNGCLRTSNVNVHNSYPPVLKRAKSMETLLLETRVCQTAESDSRKVSQLNGVCNYSANNKKFEKDCRLILTNRLINGSNGSSGLTDSNGTALQSTMQRNGECCDQLECRTNSEMIEDELPKRDTVKNCKRIFETSRISSAVNAMNAMSCVSKAGLEECKAKGCTYKKVVTSNSVSAVKRKPPVLRAAENKAVNAIRTTNCPVTTTTPGLPPKPSFLVNSRKPMNSSSATNACEKRVLSAKNSSLLTNGSQTNVSKAKVDKDCVVNGPDSKHKEEHCDSKAATKQIAMEALERIRAEGTSITFNGVNSVLNGNCLSRNEVPVKVNREEDKTDANDRKSSHDENSKQIDSVSGNQRKVMQTVSTTATTMNTINRPVANIKPFQLKESTVAIASMSSVESQVDKRNDTVVNGTKTNTKTANATNGDECDKNKCHKRYNGNTRDCTVPIQTNDIRNDINGTVDSKSVFKEMSINNDVDDCVIETRKISAWKSGTKNNAANSCSTNTMVFNFIGKKVTPSLSNRPSPFGTRSVPPEEQDDYNYTGSTELPEPSGIVFEGESVVIQTGALLIKRNKKLRVKFNDTAVATFEYPSEASLLEEMSTSNDESNAHNASVIQSNGSMVKSALKNSLAFTGSAIGGLSTYKPTFYSSEANAFELGISRPILKTDNDFEKLNHSQTNDDRCAIDVNSDSVDGMTNGFDTLKPADSSEIASWSNSSNASDLLF